MKQLQSSSTQVEIKVGDVFSIHPSMVYGGIESGLVSVTRIFEIDDLTILPDKLVDVLQDMCNVMGIPMEQHIGKIIVEYEYCFVEGVDYMTFEDFVDHTTVY